MNLLTLGSIFKLSQHLIYEINSNLGAVRSISFTIYFESSPRMKYC